MSALDSPARTNAPAATALAHVQTLLTAQSRARLVAHRPPAIAIRTLKGRRLFKTGRLSRAPSTFLAGTHQCLIVPPSTTSVCPVMKAASSQARNMVAPIKSSGTATRGMDCDAAVCATTSGAVASTIEVPSVRVKLGATQLRSAF